MDDLASQISKITNQVAEDVRDIVEKTIDEVSENALSHIKEIGGYENHRKAKNYRKNFYIKKVKRPLFVKNTLANKQYRLTHLLEDGHIVKNQHGTYGRSQAYPHWKETEDIAIKEFEEKMRNRLGGLYD